jgi:hypothetical protein
MPKVTYTESKGLVQSAGTGVQLDDLPYSTVQAKTANFNIVQPGVYTLTGGVTGTLPLAANFPGGLFVFRSGDTNLNVLTASLESAGTQALVQGTFSGNGSLARIASKVTLQNVVGSSVSMISDGKNYILMAGSGSHLLTSP